MSKSAHEDQPLVVVPNPGTHRGAHDGGQALSVMAAKATESVGNKRATSAPLHLIQSSIGSIKEGLGGSAVLGPGRDTETDGDRRLFAVCRQKRGYSPCNQAA